MESVRSFHLKERALGKSNGFHSIYKPAAFFQSDSAVLLSSGHLAGFFTVFPSVAKDAKFLLDKAI
jgi:pyruvate/2-oxoglutarate/acetoin dehydrogenase E1 component